MPIFSNQLFDYNFGYLPPAAQTTTFNITYDDLRPAAASAKRQHGGEARASAPSKRGRASTTPVDVTAINTIRLLSADMVQAANSGHPGAPMGCAPMAHALWAHIMTYNPENPKWINRDRFVLSNGHACALLYSLLHLAGFDLSLDDLKSFRSLGSKCPGHPENFHTPGVEVTTGPLGQGLSMAVGMALASAQAGATYNKDGFDLLNSHVFVICGDGCLQVFFFFLLQQLIVIWDDKKVTIDGSTDLSFTEDVLARYASYGWHTLHVPNGDDDLEGILAAIEEAKACTDRPTMIRVSTTIGKGSKNEVTATLLFCAIYTRGRQRRPYPQQPHEGEGCTRLPGERCCDLFCPYLSTPRAKRFVPFGTHHKFRPFRRPRLSYLIYKPRMDCLVRPEQPAQTKRATEGVFLCVCMCVCLFRLFDLSSTSEMLANATPEGKYIRFGVREHAMAAICNGISAYGGFVPFCATFLNFAGYALGAIRVSAISQYGVCYVMTHDSIGLGEDGPTHQPIEMLLSLRSMPNLLTLRPCDSNEMILSTNVIKEVINAQPAHAASVRLERGKLNRIKFLCCVGLCVQVAELLATEGVNVRVVSMPCWELFDEQPLEYKKKVFPRGVPVLAVEAASVEGWSKYSHAIVGMSTYGASAPAKDLHKKFGFTVDNVAMRGREVLSFYAKGGDQVPWLMNRP
ncbi:Transketolase, thiamine diphosphate binding domain-containing protein [Pavlovales sp. CCMP2436]|nr:Transketolase, thiamine diphosphate binding domain-containing protein [Pavlovales sp. CCMP2436]